MKLILLNKMKKVLLLLLFVLPISMLTTSCSHDNDDVTEWYDNVLKEKAELIAQLKSGYAGRQMELYCGGVMHQGLVYVDGIIIENGHTVVFTHTSANNVTTVTARLELINFVGYEPNAIFFQ